MKRKNITIVFLLLIVSVAVLGLTTVPTNQITVECDAVAKIEPEDVIAYEWFRTPHPITAERQADPETGEIDPIHEKLDVTMDPTILITFAIEGEYVIGVRTVRSVLGGATITYSEINWSDVDDPPGSTPIPFVIEYARNPDSSVNLRYL